MAEITVPAVLLAWQHVGDNLTALTLQDESLAEDWHRVGHLLVEMADGGRHAAHGGWTYEPRTRELVCACGEPVYPAAEVA